MSEENNTFEKNIELSNKPIAIFDSGIGGVNVLKFALEALPNEDFIYYGDIKYAPYGEKTQDFIKERAINITNFLREKGIKMLVVACNTATSISIRELRRLNPDLIILGVEPAIKPAAEYIRKTDKNIPLLVLATKATTNSENTRRLIDNYAEDIDIYTIPCSGLMELIENRASKEEMDNYFSENIDELVGDEPVSIVLGCTHYVFLVNYLENRYKNAKFFFGDTGTVRNIKRLLKLHNLENTSENKDRKVEILSSQDGDDFSLKVKNLIKN